MTPYIEVFSKIFREEGDWIEREDTHHNTGETESKEAKCAASLLQTFPSLAREVKDELGDVCSEETHTT